MKFNDVKMRIYAEVVDISYESYVELEGFMLRVNQNVRSQNFKLSVNNSITSAFKKVYSGYQSVLGNERIKMGTRHAKEYEVKHFISERHGEA